MPHNATAVLTIASGGTASGQLSAFWSTETDSSAGRVAIENATAITIKTPAALTGTIAVQVAQKRGAVAGDFATLKNDDGTDVTLTADRSQIVDLPAAVDLRLLSTLAEGAARDFRVSFQESL